MWWWFFAHKLSKKGAEVIGIDYSRFAIEFAEERYPDVDFRVQSGYDLGIFKENSFDVLTLFDVVEHMSN